MFTLKAPAMIEACCEISPDCHRRGLECKPRGPVCVVTSYEDNHLKRRNRVRFDGLSLYALPSV